MRSASLLPPPVGDSSGRREWVALVVGTLAAALFVTQMASLSALQWLDAWVVGYLDGLRASLPDSLAVSATQTAPYMAADFVIVGVLAAYMRGMRRGDVAWVLGLFALALLLVEALKVVVARDRPGAVPWAAVGGSFPSGHVADAALAVLGALRLARRRDRADLLVVLLGVVGAVFVVVIAFTRVYLGRHWPTDVTASLLLALCFWSATFVPRTLARSWVVAAAVLVVLGLYVTSAVGGRIRLTSPTTHSEQLELASVDGTWIPSTQHRERGFFRLAGNEVDFRLHETSGAPTLLKVVARGLGHPKAPGCRSIDVLVDGTVVSHRPLRLHWRSYAFALPRLEPGVHEVAVRASHAPHRTLALHEIEVEGAGAAVALTSLHRIEPSRREAL
jgi:membrane-associated phospholipid phosphatase